VDERDRRFTSWLAIVFGPLFVLGGFVAAFTEPGAWFIAVGMGLLASGILLRTRAWTSAAAAAGIAIAAGLIAWFEAGIRA
jgi:hypothetical protein